MDLVPKLRLGTRVCETPFRDVSLETEFRGQTFPNGVWEREKTRKTTRNPTRTEVSTMTSMLKSYRSPVLSLLAAMACILLINSEAHAGGKPAKKPNILFILVDDMGWTDLQ